MDFDSGARLLPLNSVSIRCKSFQAPWSLSFTLVFTTSLVWKQEVVSMSLFYVKPLLNVHASHKRGRAVTVKRACYPGKRIMCLHYCSGAY